jgi:hypothetical protein
MIIGALLASTRKVWSPDRDTSQAFDFILASECSDNNSDEFILETFGRKVETKLGADIETNLMEPPIQLALKENNDLMDKNLYKAYNH